MESIKVSLSETEISRMETGSRKTIFFITCFYCLSTLMYLPCHTVYTRLVLFNIWLLAVPSPILNKAPPARHPMTFMMLESSGVSAGIMEKNNIPIQNDPTRESHVFCFATTLISRYTGTNADIKNIFDKKHIIISTVPTVPASKDSPEIAPPRMVPMKKARIIDTPQTIQAIDLDIT